MSSAEWPRDFILLWSWAHCLIYFSIYVAISLLPLAYVIRWPTRHLGFETILARSWSSWLCVRKSSIHRSLLYSTSRIWPTSTLKLSSSFGAASGEKSGSAVRSMVRSLSAFKNRVLSIWNITILGSISNNSTFWSDVINRVILWSLRSLSTFADLNTFLILLCH